MKEKFASPSVTTETIFLTSMIDAKENRQVAVVELTGLFLHAENDQDVIMFISKRLAKLMTVVAQQTYKNM